MDNHWQIIQILLIIQVCSAGLTVVTSTLTTKKVDDQIGNLVDALQTVPWESCDEAEICTLKKVAQCAKGESPSTQCGTIIWREEVVGCHKCAGEWLPIEPAACDGTDCSDTVQRHTHVCANGGQNPDCRLVTTRFCAASTICYGAWSTWTTDPQECLQQCKENGFRMKKRMCIREGKESSSCEEKANGNTDAAAMIETVYESCKNHSCPTAAEARVVLTAWSEWVKCTARCSMPTGKEMRYRECIYEDGKDAPMDKCDNKQPIKQERQCFYDTSTCTKPTQTTQTEVTTSDQKQKLARDVTNPNPDAGFIEKLKKVLPAKELTRGTNLPSTETTVELQREKVTRKWQYQIIVIVVATSACLIILAIIVFLCCRRSKKNRRQKSIKKGISIVALQAHSGLTDGGEFERLRKSTVSNNSLAAVYSEHGHSSLANFDLSAGGGERTTPSRRLPKPPVTCSGSAENVPDNHVYEEMGHLKKTSGGFSAEAESDLQSSSIRNTRKRAHTFVASPQAMLPFAQRQGKSVSLHRKELLYPSPKKIAPAKPPRKSMMLLLDTEMNEDCEVREIPKSLYNSKENLNRRLTSPDLQQFISSIQPPLGSPPPTPSTTTEFLPHKQERFLSLGNHHHGQRVNGFRSAPVSPNRGNMLRMNNVRIVNPAIPYMSPGENRVMTTSPATNVQWVVPAASGGRVIYVPVSPLYPNSMAAPVQSTTPLHSNPQAYLRHSKSYRPPPRPKTMGFVPQISVSDADDGRNLAPPPGDPCQNLSAYADMRCLHLHGTHNMTPEHNSRITSSMSACYAENGVLLHEATDDNLEEDREGYLVPNSPRSAEN